MFAANTEWSWRSPILQNPFSGSGFCVHMRGFAAARPHKGHILSPPPPAPRVAPRDTDSSATGPPGTWASCSPVLLSELSLAGSHRHGKALQL